MGGTERWLFVVQSRGVPTPSHLHLELGPSIYKSIPYSGVMPSYHSYPFCCDLNGWEEFFMGCLRFSGQASAMDVGKIIQEPELGPVSILVAVLGYCYQARVSWNGLTDFGDIELFDVVCFDHSWVQPKCPFDGAKKWGHGFVVGCSNSKSIFSNVPCFNIVDFHGWLFLRVASSTWLLGWLQRKYPSKKAWYWIPFCRQICCWNSSADIPGSLVWNKLTMVWRKLIESFRIPPPPCDLKVFQGFSVANVSL